MTSFKAAIDALQPGGEARDLDDRGVSGLLVRRLWSGRSVYYLNYTTKMRRRTNIKLGDVNIMTLGEARAAARELLLRVAAGGDPQAERDEARGEMTVAELFDRTHRDLWLVQSSAKYAKQVLQNFNNHARPKLGKLRLSEVTPVVLRDWHMEFAQSAPYVGNRILAALSRMFTYAEERGWRDVGLNPCRPVKPHKERERATFADPDADLPKLLEILDRRAATQPAAVAFTYALLFSGARIKSLEDARRDELRREVHDGEVYGVLSFVGKSTHKTGQNEEVIFVPQVMRMIDALPQDGELIFGIKEPVRFWREVREELGRPDLWFRDLRRTFASVGLEAGVSAAQIGESLNHRHVQTTKRYARLRSSARVQTVAKIAGQIGARKK